MLAQPATAMNKKTKLNSILPELSIRKQPSASMATHGQTAMDQWAVLGIGVEVKCTISD